MHHSKSVRDGSERLPLNIISLKVNPEKSQKLHKSLHKQEVYTYDKDYVCLPLQHMPFADG